MVAPLNSSRSRSKAIAMSRNTGAASWLTAATVARITGGEVLQRGRTAETIVTDSRQDCANKLFVALRGDNHDGHAHCADAVRKGARGLLVSVPLHELGGLDRAETAPFVVRVTDTTDAMLRLAAEHRRRQRARVIGITGSCGKTTVKEWLGSVLASAMETVRSPASFNNQVGVPITLFQVQPETRAAVVEIGTNAPGEIASLAAVASPDVAIVTCVAAAHLAGLGSIDGVAREKADLPRSVGEAGLCILNADDPNVKLMAGLTKARVQFVAIDKPADWYATNVQFHAMGTSFLLQGHRPVTIPRVGTHNVYNALFVIAAASEMGVPEDQVLQVLATVPPASRRLEPKVAGGVTVFDDTYNMNPQSARAGLQALAGMAGGGRRIAVFGEMLELGSASEQLHRELGAEVVRQRMDHLVCVGEGASPIRDGAIAAGMPAARVVACRDVAEAHDALRAMVRAGDRVLCKASRRVALDRLVDRLVTSIAVGGGGVSAEAN
ncbi:MAG: hypothetical protein RIT25_690 [Planctomycetota bacterium]|jgi:UDP-N-acetylmuramoyl-tripeptide--D-alanyl-D-alanine ligase